MTRREAPALFYLSTPAAGARDRQGQPLSLPLLRFKKELNPIKRNVDGVFRFKQLPESFNSKTTCQDKEQGRLVVF